jgi:stress response protein YsnF
VDEPQPETIVSAEEIARVDTRRVVTGRVRVATRVETTEETLRAELEGDVVDVVRVPVDRVVDSVPAIRVEGDETIVPVVEEILFVEKRLVLKEEIRIRRRTETHPVEVRVDLRSQQATVERLDGDTETTPEETPS